MTLADVLQVLAALSSAGAFLASWHNANKIHQVHLQFNSRFDELLKMAQIKAMAEGNLVGRAEQKAEDQAKNPPPTSTAP